MILVRCGPKILKFFWSWCGAIPRFQNFSGAARCGPRTNRLLCVDPCFLYYDEITEFIKKSAKEDKRLKELKKALNSDGLKLRNVFFIFRKFQFFANNKI